MKDITVATLISFGNYLGFHDTHKYVYEHNGNYYAYNGKGLTNL